MPTVSAAIEGLSSCSQNVAYSANIIAAQVRKAKTQAETGNPAIVVIGRAPSVLVTGRIRACARAALASLRGMLRSPSWTAGEFPTRSPSLPRQCGAQRSRTHQQAHPVCRNAARRSPPAV